MPHLKTRDTWPSEGFKFLDPQISDKEVGAGMGFTALVDKVIRDRRANPRFNLSTDRKTVEEAVDVYNAIRLSTMRGCEAYIVMDDGGPLPKFQARAVPPPRSGAVAGIKRALEGPRRLTVGIRVLMDWLGAGLMPVTRELAEKRAAVCADCPQNDKGSVGNWFAARTAETLKQLMQAKMDRKAETTLDARLYVCKACKCHLPLKVHCPLEHILAHEDRAIQSELDPRCWVLKEQG